MANRSRNNKDANIDADLDRGWQLSHACQCCVDIIALSSPKCPAAAPSSPTATPIIQPIQHNTTPQPAVVCDLHAALSAKVLTSICPVTNFGLLRRFFYAFFYVVFLFFRCFDPSCKYKKKQKKKSERKPQSRRKQEQQKCGERLDQHRDDDVFWPHQPHAIIIIIIIITRDNSHNRWGWMVKVVRAHSLER